MPHTTNLDCCSMISKAQQQNIQKSPVTVADSLNLNQWNGALKGNFNAVSIANRYHSVWQPTMPNAQFELIKAGIKVYEPPYIPPSLCRQ